MSGNSILAHLVYQLEQSKNRAFWAYYRRLPFSKTEHFLCDIQPIAERDRVDIVTVAFNNPFVIGYQIKLIKKYLDGPYCLTIADNSSDLHQQAEIKQLCELHQVAYFKLPPNPHQQINLSHSLALNWIYYNYIRPRDGAYFGFLDHDIFPIGKTNLSRQLQTASMYGCYQERKLADKIVWYLWPGFCFYQAEPLKRKELNFSCAWIMPNGKINERFETDTGGANWQLLYAQTNLSNVNLCGHKYGVIQQTENQPVKIDIYNSIEEIAKINNMVKLEASFSLVELLDDWLHLRKAASKIGLGDNQEIKSLLESYLN